MDDLISRQAAFDSLTEYGNGRAVYISVEEAVRRMEKLPSALPEAPDIHVGNMVSISAVVDMAGKSEWFESSDAYNDFVWAINALPSAQPNEQIMWERDVAVEQLRQLGYGFGETIRTEKDCISRQAAIELAMQYCPDDDGTCSKADEDIRNLLDELEALPPAQPEQRWIPCRERLPEDGRQVLVYARSVHYALAKYDEMREADGTYRMQWVTFDAWKPYYTIKDVVAWMPLPEPYAERQK